MLQEVGYSSKGINERDIADGWRTLPFNEAVLLNPTVRLERGEIYSFVRMADISADARSAYPSEQRPFRGGGSRFRNGDTLMARITPCLENGKIARYHAKDATEAAHGSTEFIVIRGRPEVTDNAFAYYLTRWDKVRNYAITQMTGTSGRQRVPINSLEHLIVPIPPLPEQRRIAHILGTLDDKIALNRRMNETLEEMARALFKAWFVDFEPVRAKIEGRWRRGKSLPGMPAELYDQFPDRLVDSELGAVPEGWEIKALDEIANFRNGLALQKFRPKENEERLPVVKIAQLRTNKANSGEWAKADITPECIIDDGDVIFSWSGSLLVTVWCGGKAALNQHLFKVTSGQYPKWFYRHFTEVHLAEFQRIAADKATTMGHIKRQHLSEAKCVVPDLALLSAVDETFSNLLAKAISVNVESRTLAAMRDTLLPKLISGEVRMSSISKENKDAK